jgi:hypothetical protein
MGNVKRASIRDHPLTEGRRALGQRIAGRPPRYSALTVIEPAPPGSRSRNGIGGTSWREAPAGGTSGCGRAEGQRWGVGQWLLGADSTHDTGAHQAQVPVALQYIVYTIYNPRKRSPESTGVAKKCRFGRQ